VVARRLADHPEKSGGGGSTSGAELPGDRLLEDRDVQEGSDRGVVLEMSTPDQATSITVLQRPMNGGKKP